MKRKIILCLIPIGFYFLTSCEKHSDYDQLKQENEALKAEINVLKKDALRRVNPSPLSFFEKSKVKKGEMMDLSLYMGCTIEGSNVQYVLMDPKTGEYTDTLKSSPFLGYGHKRFIANEIGKHTLEGIMIFTKENKRVALPFSHDYEVK